VPAPLFSLDLAVFPTFADRVKFFPPRVLFASPALFALFASALPFANPVAANGAAPGAGAYSAPPPSLALAPMHDGIARPGETIAGIRAAAERGDPAAQTRLGRLLARLDSDPPVPRDDAEAAKWLRLAAGQGYADGQFSYAFLLENGRGVEENKTEAARLYTLAHEQNFPRATRNLAFLYRDGAGGLPRDPARAAALVRAAVVALQHRAQHGNARAQADLARMLLGTNQAVPAVPVNAVEAERWLLASDAQGGTDAQINLALIHYNGAGVIPRDFAVAAKYFRLAAEKGSEYAQVLLANMYWKGEGVPRDPAESAKWQRRAADLNDPAAALHTAAVLNAGTGVPRDPAAALHYYKLAARLGNARAMLELAHMLQVGRPDLGLPADAGAARQWLARAAATARKLAESGDVPAQALLGAMLNNGNGIPRDHTEAAKWLRAAAAQGNASAQALLGTMHLHGHGVEKNIVEALRWYLRALEQNDPTAQHMVGTLLLAGAGGVARDYAKALDLLQKSAAQGDIDAIADIGLCHLNGFAVPKNSDEAAKYFRQAAALGSVSGQFHLGRLYAAGDGVEKNPAEALRLFHLAAAREFAPAQTFIGQMHFWGHGIPQDYAEAKKWYQLAAAQNDAQGQTGLGDLHANGLGVPKDEAEAAKWYALAAEQGEPGAQCNLGVLYEYGRGGLPLDYAKMAELYKKSAAQNHAQALDNLGLAYAAGRGVERNPEEALRLFRAAAGQGHPQAAAHIKAAEEMLRAGSGK
jgi:TPR repeat protein